MSKQGYETGRSLIDYKHLNELYNHIMEHLEGRPKDELINLLQDYTDLMLHMSSKEETRKVAHDIKNRSQLLN